MARMFQDTEGRGIDSEWVLKHGAIGGLIGAIVFAMAEMVAAWLSGGNFFGPLHMMASIPLQQPPPEIARGTALLVGTLFHLAYSVVLGIIVAYIVASVAALRNSSTATIVFATVVGFIIWPLNFYVIAPAINAPWFATETNPFLQFIFHTFAFGTVLGVYLAAQLPSLENE
ncbi:MAG: hypothetical protein M3220_13835 [Chloroflexota bacterium]|nr:hypothetical protein [Chloroflexota bacterium]